MTNGAVTAGDRRATTRMRVQPPALPALFLATGLALAYAGALAALLLGTN